MNEVDHESFSTDGGRVNLYAGHGTTVSSATASMTKSPLQCCTSSPAVNTGMVPEHPSSFHNKQKTFNTTLNWSFHTQAQKIRV